MSILHGLPLAFAAAGALGETWEASRGRPPAPRRHVLGPDLARREARRRRAKARAAQRLVKSGRGAHLVQLGPYGPTTRRPDPTGERAKRRQSRCGDCHGTGVRIHLVQMREGRQRPASWTWQRQGQACGCVAS